MAYAVHCQLFAGKYTVNVATSGGVGRDRQVTKYLDTLMLTFGSFITGSAGVSVRLSSEALEAAERKSFRLGKKLAADIKARRVYTKQENIHRATGEYFRQLVTMNKNEWVHEYEFWRRASRSRSTKNR
jgi:hypothetical protein